MFVLVQRQRMRQSPCPSFEQKQHLYCGGWTSIWDTRTMQAVREVNSRPGKRCSGTVTVNKSGGSPCAACVLQKGKGRHQAGARTLLLLETGSLEKAVSDAGPCRWQRDLWKDAWEMWKKAGSRWNSDINGAYFTEPSVSWWHVLHTYIRFQSIKVLGRELELS